MSSELRVRKHEHVVIEGVDVERWYFQDNKGDELRTLMLCHMINPVFDTEPDVFVEVFKHVEKTCEIYDSNGAGQPDDPNLCNPFS